MENGPVLLIGGAMFPIVSQVCDFSDFETSERSFSDFEACGRFCPSLRQRANVFRIRGTFGKCLTDQVRKKFDVNSPMSTLCLELAQNLVDVTKMFLQDCPRRV